MKPISKTAFYTCGVRMLDAEGHNPVCGDSHAKVFMNEDALGILEPFRNEISPNASTVARHRIIDDVLRERLLADPSLRVVIIGAGFDTRAYRLPGGTWVELDEPQVIAYKNERLPASACPNALQRIPIDFSTESIEEKLAPFASDRPVVVVIEGVFMYLDVAAIAQLLEALRRRFPRHDLICDLMTRKFFEKQGRTLYEKITGLGATFKFTVDDPDQLFVAHGYHSTSKVSTIERAVEHQSIKLPKILFKTLFRNLVRGYTVNVFEARGEFVSR